jgi:hypothetical protein
MPNTFKPKRSSTANSVPTTGDLLDGELAVNSGDQKIYLRDGDNIVIVGAANTTIFLSNVGIGTTNTVIAADSNNTTVLNAGIVTANYYYGDGSNLTGISGSGISSVFDDTTPKLGGELDLNSNNITGTGNLNVTGIITGTSFSGIGSDITGITLGQLSNVDISAIGAGSTNYLMVYDPTVPGFKFVSPASLGINNDYNPDPDIDDFGTYP